MWRYTRSLQSTSIRTSSPQPNMAQHTTYGLAAASQASHPIDSTLSKKNPIHSKKGKKRKKELPIRSLSHLIPIEHFTAEAGQAASGAVGVGVRQAASAVGLGRGRRCRTGAAGHQCRRGWAGAARLGCEGRRDAQAAAPSPPAPKWWHARLGQRRRRRIRGRRQRRWI